MNLKLILCLLFYIIIASNLAAQDIDVYSNVGAEKFNERGFSTSASNSFENNEIISEYDGNLSLMFGTKVNLPHGLGGDFTVIQNNNVEHKVYIDNDQADRAGYSVNAPEWIFGFKGIALQTLNFEDHFFVASNGHSVFTGMKGEYVPMLIPGYHYTNKDRLLTSDGLPPFDMESHYDVIQILKADGSKINLINLWSDRNTGPYVDAAIDGKGIAYVEPSSNDLRIMYYYPGDGLKYVFKESPVSYTNQTLSQDYIIDTKIMYLTEIINPASRDGLVFNYSYDPMQFFSGWTGRKVLHMISIRPGSSFKGDLIFSINNLEDDADYPFGVSIQNNFGGEDLIFVMEYALSQALSGSPVFSGEQLGYDNCSKIEQITGVIDGLGNKTTIDYSFTHKKYEKSITATDVFFDFEIPIFLPKNIIYHTKEESVFEYYNHKPEVPADYTDFSAQLYDHYPGFFRDPLTNFMLQSRTKKNWYEGKIYKVQEEIYTFGKDGSMPDMYKAPEAYDIWTDITIRRGTTVDDGSPDKVNRKLYFNKYQVGYSLPYAGDFSSLVRLEKEITSEESNFKTVYNYWNTGAKNNRDKYWDGTFFLDSTKTTENIPGMITEKTTKYIYDPDRRQFSENIYCFKTYKNSVTIIDPSGMETKKTYFNTIPGGWSSSLYYLLGQLNSEEVKKNNHAKKLIQYSYYTGIPLKNKLKYKIDKTNGAHHLTTEYAYITEGEALNVNSIYWYRGFPKRTEYPNGLIEKFGYPSLSIDINNNLIFNASAEGIYIKDDGNIENKTFQHSGFQLQPSYKTYWYDDSTKSIQSFTSYDEKGNLIFQIDANKYYYEYEYDNLNRIKKISLPGSFSHLGTYDEVVIKNISQKFGVKIQVEIDVSGTKTPLKYGQDLTAKVQSVSFNGLPGNDYYIFFDEISLKNCEGIFSAKLVLKALNSEGVIADSEKLLQIYGITESYSNTQTQFNRTENSVQSVFSDNKTLNIDVVNILEEVRLKNNTLHGFLIKPGNSDIPMRLNFDISNPMYFEPVLMIKDTVTHNNIGSINYNYDDNLNIVTTVKRFYDDPFITKEQVTTNIFDAFGRLRKSQITDDNNQSVTKSKFEYSHLGKQHLAIDAEGRSVRKTYDYLGRVTREVFDDNSFKTYDYYPQNKTIPGTSIKAFEWSRVTDEESNTKEMYYDISGNLIGEVVGSNSPTLFEYDDINQLTKVTSPEGNVTNYEYDAWGNVSSKSSPDFGTYTYIYDCNGNLLSEIHSETGQIIKHSYDQLNRLIATSVGGEADDNTKQVLVNMYDDWEPESGVFAGMSVPSGYTAENTKGRLVATAYRDKPGDDWNYKLYSYDYLGRVNELLVYE